MSTLPTDKTKARWLRALPPLPSVLLSIVSVQAGAALAKTLFPAFGPAGTTTLRTLFAFALLCLVFRPSLRALDARGWRVVAPYGVALGGMNLCYYAALERLPIGLTVTLEFLGPLGVAVVSSRRAVDFAWVVLAAVGVVLLAPFTPSSQALDPIGVALALGAAAGWAAYIVLGRRVAQRVPQGEAVTFGMACAALTSLPFALGNLAHAHPTPSLLAAALGVGLLASAIPYTLEMNALRLMPARTFGVLMSLEPGVASIVGFVVLHERLDAQQVAAIACVTAASAGATWMTARR